MKRTQLQKLRAMSAEDITTRIRELSEQMLKARISRSLEGKQVGVQYRNTRREIARLHTILGQQAATKASGTSA
jgi:ribosomal protein L29